MAKGADFPWDLLKAECLRLVCTQLVQGSKQELNKYPGPGRKEDMIEFLSDVEARNVDLAVRTLERNFRSPRKSTGQAVAASPSKRKISRLEDDETAEEEGSDGYNTRFKGVKRVKVREATPEPTARTPRKTGRPRKSSQGDDVQSIPKRSPRKSTGETISAGVVKKGRGRPRKSVAEAEPATSTSVSEAEVTTTAEPTVEASTDGETKDSASEVKRGRGRPRKSDAAAPKIKAKPAPKAKPQPSVDADGNFKRGRGRPRKSISDKPLSKGKQVFDGVLLEKRKPVSKDHAAAAVAEEDNADAEYEEEDAVLAAVNNNGYINDGASSLGGSNKENDPIAIDMFRYTPADQDEDMDADADGDPDGEAEPILAATTTTTIVAAATTTTTTT